MTSTKKSVVVAGLAIAGLALGACGGGTGAGTSAGASGGSGQEATTIKLVAAEYSKDHTKAFWDAFAKTYKEKTGYTLEVQVVSWDNIDQQSSTMIQNNQAPDILNLNAYASYAKDGLLYDSDDGAAGGRQERHPRHVRQVRHVPGQVLRLPRPVLGARASSTTRRSSSRPASPTRRRRGTELEADAKKITALGNGNVGYALPLGPEESQGEFSMWLFNNGGDWKTDGKWVINSDKNVETLTFLKKLSDEKVTQNNPARTNRADAFDLFKSGKAGMVIGFSPLAGALDADKKVDYGVAPFPSNDGTESKTFGVTDYLMAFKKPGNEKAVKAFYDLYYQPDQVNTFIKAEGFLPVTKTGVQQFSSDPKLKVYLDTLPNAKLTPTDDPTWDKVKLAVQQNLGGAMTGSPKATLDGLQKTAENGG